MKSLEKFKDFPEPPELFADLLDYQKSLIEAYFTGEARFFIFGSFPNEGVSKDRKIVSLFIENFRMKNTAAVTAKGTSFWN